MAGLRGPIPRAFRWQLASAPGRLGEFGEIDRNDERP